ncbi:MAG: cytochrome c oxidase assembly protein [Rhodospirillales bacterium]|nr:cytochrome c oxidase assembly protein [Rhodospirillales bacterium]
MLLSLCLADQPPARWEGIWQAWSLAPEVVLPLVAALALYAGGAFTLRSGGGAPGMCMWRMACFAAGWLVLAAALVSPLCRMAATLAWAHMLQHLMLVAVAPPLLVLGRFGAAVEALVLPRPRDHEPPDRGLRHRATFGAYHKLRSPMCAAALYGALIWLWHVPWLYQQALLDPLVHLSMYGSLLAAALLFWNSLIRAASLAPESQIAALAASLVTTVHTGLLGALLTFSPVLWYPLLAPRADAWGLSPLEDQQLAGLIMWVPMGFLYAGAAAALGAAWLAAMERRNAPLMRTAGR